MLILSYLLKEILLLPVQFHLKNTILHVQITMSNHVSKSIIPSVKLDLIFNHVICLHMICSGHLFYVDKKNRSALLDLFFSSNYISTPQMQLIHQLGNTIKSIWNQ